MQVGVTSSDDNPTHSYLNSRGIWLTYILIIFVAHLLFLSVPFFSVAIAWTLTNVIHDLIMFVILHVTKGTPWETPDQGIARSQTQWEQIDNGMQFTPTKKFLTTVPIVFGEICMLTYSGNFRGQSYRLSQGQELILRHVLKEQGIDQCGRNPANGNLFIANRGFIKPANRSRNWYRFFLASFYTKYDKVHFLMNASVLALNLIPKLPQFHGVRLFNINKW